MKNAFFSLFSFSIISTALLSGYFDIKELKEVSYNTDLSDDFLWFAPDIDVKEINEKNIDKYEAIILEKLPKETESDFIFLTNGGGQRFICKIPNIQYNNTENAIESSKNPKYYADFIAASFYVNKCITLRSNGWWNYELCRGQKVEQIHEKQGNPGYVKNILGIFEGTYSMPEYTKSTSERLLYVEEVYSSGTFCDLENHKIPRKTFVRYTCDPELSSHEAYIASIEEISPCKYVMVVKIGSLCAFSEFLVPNQKNTHKIGCYPHLEAVNIRKFLMEYVDNKHKKKLLKKRTEKLKKDFSFISRRYAAMKRTKINYSVKDFFIVSNLFMDYHAINFDLIVAALSEKEGKQISRERSDALWELFSMTNVPDYVYYNNYNSISDENKGNLWYYFNRKDWPKNEFPKDLENVIIKNAHLEYLKKIWARSVTSSENFDPSFLLNKVQDLIQKSINNADNIYLELPTVFEEMVNRFSLLAFRWQRYLVDWFSVVKKPEEIPHQMILHYVSEKKNENEAWPMANFSKSLTEDHLIEIGKAFESINSVGYVYLKEMENIEKDKYEVLKYLKFERETDEKGEYHYKIKIDKSIDEIREELEDIFVKWLSPFYFVISWKYYHKLQPETYYPHPNLTFIDDTNDKYFAFHQWLAKDLIEFSRLLAAGTTWKIKNEVDRAQNIGTYDKTKTTEDYFLRNWPSLKKSLDKARKVSENVAIRKALEQIFVGSGKKAFDEAKMAKWKYIQNEYITLFERNDRKKRLQAESLLNVMSSMVKDEKTENSSPVMTYGEFGAKKSELVSQVLFENEEMTLNDFLNEEANENMDNLEYSNDDEFKKISDLLEKSGIGKEHVDVKVQMINEDGKQIEEESVNEIISSTMEGVFEQIEAKQKFKKMEQIYFQKEKWKNEDENSRNA